MSHHNWSDKKFDWKGLSEALDYILHFLRKYGRINCNGKEKYGSLRVSCYFGMLSLHALLYPCNYPVPRDTWYWNLDSNYIAPFLQKWFEKPYTWYQTKIYNMAYMRAINKWPHLRAEILVDADYLEFIPGVIRKVGKTTLVLGWKGETVGSWTSL